MNDLLTVEETKELLACIEKQFALSIKEIQEDTQTLRRDPSEQNNLFSSSKAQDNRW